MTEGNAEQRRKVEQGRTDEQERGGDPYVIADRLIDLAFMVAARHGGVTRDEVAERFEVTIRTSKRMLDWLERRFPDDTQATIDYDGRKRWRLHLEEISRWRPEKISDLMTLSAEEVVALELAAKTMKNLNLTVEAGHLQGLSDKIMVLVSDSKRVKIETDLGALLEAQGLAARPGPRQRVHRRTLAAIAEAIKAGHILEVEYQPREEPSPTLRRLAPYGLLTGLRRYLLARPADDPTTGPIRHYILENIRSAKVAPESFDRDPAFSLQAFADRAFGVFQSDEEYGEVVWRFLPAAAPDARSFVFHPNQQVEEQSDGSLIVRFRASGDLEMCWHLYMWGDQVEVLAPERLRDMVHPWRRSDFPGLP